MQFTDLFIRRPVFATVLSLIILLLGIRAYFYLPVRLYPKIDVNAVNVSVSYPGTAAAIMEGFVTTPIENAISGVDGIDYISSYSSDGLTNITIYFKLDYDVNKAITDVSDKVASVRWQLPQEIYDPIIDKNDPNASPTMYLAFDSKSMSGEELTDYLKRSIQPQLQVLNGVGQVQIHSAHEYGMRVWLNPHAMAAYGITPNDVQKAIFKSNLQAPSGTINTNSQTIGMSTIADLTTGAQFNNLVLKNNNGQLTRIKDIGKAELSSAITETSVYIDGKPGAVIAVTPQPNANPLEVSVIANKCLTRLKSSMPTGLNFKLLVDTSDFISASIDEVKKTIMEAALFVIAIVFLFLGSWRVLAVPAITIPLSIVGVFGVMLTLGYSLNTLTYLALILAIGMVVDDAIVVAENIYRHVTLGKKPFEAAIHGAREIQFAIISMTLTLAAVYAPIGFMPGVTGILFKEFAFTLASAVIISGFIALTLSPMMCAKMLTVENLSSNLTCRIHNLSDGLTHFYQTVLAQILNQRKYVIGALGFILVSSIILYKTIPSDLAPKEDMGWIYSFISAPATANLKFTENYTKRLIPIFENLPEKNHYGIISQGGTGSAMAFLSLKDWNLRKRKVDAVIAELFPKYWFIPGITAFPINPHRLPGAGSMHPVSINLQTMHSYAELNKINQAVMAAMRQNPNIQNIDTDLKIDQPELDININRNKAGDLGIPIDEIATAINVSFGAPTTTHFNIEGRSYNVIPQIFDNYRSNPNVINSIQVRTNNNELVPLGNVVEIKNTVRPRTINHFQQLRAANITADLRPGYTLGQALTYAQNVIKKTVPQAKIQIDYSGQSRQFVESGGAMAITFIFALIFIFLVLAAQFESFRDPLIVMFSVPLSCFGALLALKLIGGTLNIYSEIGIVTLIGLISKHGILIVEFANQLQETGKEPQAAIIEAAAIRLRPILMTTLAMILGALPLAFASGAGAISRQQIGWVIVGGMSIGTLFTLFVIPTIYTFLVKKK